MNTDNIIIALKNAVDEEENQYISHETTGVLFGDLIMDLASSIGVLGDSYGDFDTDLVSIIKKSIEYHYPLEEELILLINKYKTRD